MAAEQQWTRQRAWSTSQSGEAIPGESGTSTEWELQREDMDTQDRLQGVPGAPGARSNGVLPTGSVLWLRS